MELFVDLIYAILLCSGWCGLIKYRRSVKSWTGNFVWAETYLGRWGTYTVMILFWLGMIFLGVIYPFGWLEMLTGWNWNSGLVPLPSE